jgi:hypothetical protein
MRKVVELTAQLCEDHGLSDWRQSAYNVRHLKRLMRAAQNKKRSKAKSEKQKKNNEALIIEAHHAYLDVAQRYLRKAQDTLAALQARLVQRTCRCSQAGD